MGMMPPMAAAPTTQPKREKSQPAPDQPLVLGARQEIQWLIGAIVVGLVISLISGLPLLLVPMVAVIGYALWLIRRTSDVVAWLDSGTKAKRAPQSAGVGDALISAVHREKRNNAKHKDRYKRALGQFNALASELPDATIVINEHRQIRWANASALSLLGVHPERDRGQRIDNLLRDPAMQAFLAQPAGSAEAEVAAPRAPEKTLAMSMTASGRNMFLLIARDVTQRVRIREMRKGFVADVSHELRTPLTVINGYLEVLLDDRTLPPSVQKALRQVDEQSDRMRHLVEHLLELSKLEGNPLGEDEGEPVMLASTITSIAQELGRSSPQHEFRIAVDPLLSVRGTHAELFSLCQNLMTNATRYTEAGTRITVTWALQPDGDAVFAVKDNGQGIELHHLPRLSERFYRVDRGRSRDNGGTGLGLAIVKHVAQRHGGELAIDSKPGSGSSFTVRFPAARCRQIDDAFPEITPSASVG